MTARAARRHHRDRYRRRNARNYPTWPNAWRFGDTRCRCGRPCCCRARDVYGVTVQELRNVPIVATTVCVHCAANVHESECWRCRWCDQWICLRCGKDEHKPGCPGDAFDWEIE